MSPLKTNEKQLVEFGLQAGITPPLAFGWEVDRKGNGMMLPSVGGITYNIQIGDSVYLHVGDHLEAGVSCIAGSFNDKRSANPNLSLNIFSCIGNEAVLISGNAKGAKGYVVGHHGGVEHVIVHFDEKTIKKLSYDDKIMIHAVGQGLKLNDYPEIPVFNLAPTLLHKMPIKPNGKKLKVPVVATVPAELMGSGMGHSDTFKGDYDIQTSDAAAVKKHGIDKLRYGDLVAILDHEAQFGWSFKKGAVSIAVVAHGNSFLAGHGPGVSTIMTSPTGLIEPTLDKNANVGNYLKIGRFKK